MARPIAAGHPTGADIPAIAGLPMIAVTGFSTAAAGVPDVVACGTILLVVLLLKASLLCIISVAVVASSLLLVWAADMDRSDFVP